MIIKMHFNLDLCLILIISMGSVTFVHYVNLYGATNEFPQNRRI